MSDEFTDKERRMLETWIAVEPPSDFADRVLVDTGRRWLPYAIAGTSVAVAAAVLVLVLRPETVVEEPRVLVALPADAGAGVEPRVIDAGVTALAADAATIAPSGPYDVDLEVGQTATIHDPSGEPRINFFSSHCRAGMQVDIARDNRFQPRTGNQGHGGVVMQVSTGAWMYRASCMAGGMAEPPFALGRVIVVRDAGRRPLPKAPASVTVQPDGRTWRISYQTEVPEIMIAQPPGGEQLHVSSPKGPKVVNIRGARGDVHVGLSDLEDGTHTYWFTRGGVTVGKVSTLVIDFDQTAPQVMLDLPKEGERATSSVQVRGMTTKGWTVRFEATPIPTDAEQRFLALVPLRTGFTSIAVRFDHPQRGTHYYVRRLR